MRNTVERICPLFQFWDNYLHFIIESNDVGTCYKWLDVTVLTSCVLLRSDKIKRRKCHRLGYSIPCYQSEAQYCLMINVQNHPDSESFVILNICHESYEKLILVSYSRKMNTLTLQRHTHLIEILEVPQLMDTCVRNCYYDEALELAAYVKRMEKKHSSIPVIAVSSR